MDKKEFYKTINILVSTSRIDNEEAYIINNYVSGLENIIKEVREYLKQRIKEVEDEELRYVEMTAKTYIMEQKELLEILDKGE